MKKSIFLFFAAILCATSAWAANVGFESYDCGIKYTQNNGSATEWNFSGQAEQSKTLEGNTTSLLMNEWFACMYQDADNTIYGQDYHKFQYKIHRTAESAGTNGFKTVNANWWSWENWDWGYRHPKGGNNWANINLLEGIGSGNYTMTFYFQHNGDKTYESKVNTLKWTTNVPDVSSISCSSNGAGTGTEDDPFLVPVGKTLTLSVSGTQKYNDPNSTLYAKFGTGTYSSTVTHDLMPTSTKQSITISVKYYNNTDDLTGGEKTITVYYQTLAEETNDVTIVCKCGGVEIQPSGEPISVGVSTVSAIPAPTIPNYIFTSWEVGDGINAVDVSANPISITTKASGDYTLTANYERSLYYYLTGNDAVFGMEGESTWHPDGVKMTWDEASKKYSHTVSLVTNKYYKFRVTDGTWEGKWGYSKLNPAIDELLAAEDDNILFALSKAGELTIAFDGTSIELTTTGEFAAPVYTIVGVETLTGSDWNLNDANNNMTQSTSDKNIYTLEKNVELAAGDYTYKAVRNYSYDWSVPSSGNNTLNVEEAGSGKITYTLNVANYTLEAELSDWVTGSVAQDVKLVGIDEDKVFTEADDQTTTSVEVELEANQIYTFNVVVNGTYKYNNGAMWRSNCTDWAFDNAGMGQVATIITDLAGTYTFTWTYEGNKLSVTYPDGTNVPAPVFLGGGMNEWNWIATRLIPSADGKTASVTVNLTAESTTEFKIKEGDTHLGNDGTMTREYHEGFIFSEKKQDSEEAQVNAKIYADATGEYTFTWTYETNALTVDYPEIVTEPATITLTTGNNDDVIAANMGKTVNVVIERSFTANDGFYTLCVPFNMPASVIGKAYSLGTITKHVTGESIDIELVEVSELLVGMPYLVLPKANMSELVVENVTIQSDPASGQNVTNEERTVNIFFEGFYSAPGRTTNGTIEYYVGNNGYLYKGEVEIPGLSGLFTITDWEGNPLNVRARVVTREEVETGFENITNGENTTIKLIENGQLIIIRNGEKFNAQGQKL